MNWFELIFSTAFLFSMLRISTPLIFASLAALVTRKAGITNIAIEGTMLISALTGVVVSAMTQSALVGVLLAVVMGLGVALILGYFALKLKTDMFLAGIAMNMFASGGTVLALYIASGDKGISTGLLSKTLPNVTLPIIADIPFVGAVLSGHNLMTYLALLSVVAVQLLMFKTKIGLRIRSVGENEHLAESVGLSVDKIRLIALLISGALSALAGAYLSMGYVSWFNRDMTAGRGFIGLSAMNLGNATPIGSFLASLLFGFAEALTNRLQALSIPVEFVAMTPYVIAIIGLVVFSVIRERQEKKVQKHD